MLHRYSGELMRVVRADVLGYAIPPKKLKDLIEDRRQEQQERVQQALAQLRKNKSLDSD